MVKTLPSNAGGADLIPDRGAEIPHAWRPRNQNIKQEQYCNKFNKDFKIGPSFSRRPVCSILGFRGHVSSLLQSLICFCLLFSFVFWIFENSYN